jgi:hypothetical protein
MWAAQISDTYRGNRNLGFFRTLREAEDTYDEAAREKWGEFALTNWDLRNPPKEPEIIVEVVAKPPGTKRPRPGHFKGVYPLSNGTWVAKINIDRRPIHLGCFVTAEDAARAYNEAAIAQWGDQAGWLNEA